MDIFLNKECEETDEKSADYILKDTGSYRSKKIPHECERVYVLKGANEESIKSLKGYKWIDTINNLKKRIRHEQE